MKRIKETPSHATKIKIDHFSNIGVIEVFLESVPTAFIIVLLSIAGLSEENGTSGLGFALFGGSDIYSFGRDPLSSALFCLTCITSFFSAGFGMARYKVFSCEEQL